MKKIIGIGLASAVMLAVIRRFGPALRDRAMAKCRGMVERSSARAFVQDRESLVPTTVG